MDWTLKRIIIAIIMVTTGSINTLSTKWADMIKSSGYTGESHYFSHPFIQTCGMFLGESLCLLAYYIYKYYKNRRHSFIVNDLDRETQPLLVSALNENEEYPNNLRFSPFIFLPPALCDMIATSLMYFALILTYASSFQMLRGAVIVFTGLISVTFLFHKLSAPKWIGIFIILVGLILVGLSDVLLPEKNESSDKPFDKNGIISGDLLIILAQIIVACQVCYEERYITMYNVHPLQAVGWEGVFGFVILTCIVFVMNFIPLPATSTLYPPLPGTRMVVEDVRDAFYQIRNSKLLALAVIGNILSISVFNFAGISVTKEMSATTRMVLDSLRTLFIWLFSLAVLWQKFHYLQLLGFAVLIMGMVIYEKLYTKLIPNRHTHRTISQNILL